MGKVDHSGLLLDGLSQSRSYWIRVGRVARREGWLIRVDHSKSGAEGWVKVDRIRMYHT